MSLSKSNLDISFAQGLDTKADPKRVQPGKFLALSNSVFTKGGLLSKRNGFGSLPALPVTDTKTLTTFGGSLTAVGENLYNLAPENNTWYNKGPITGVSTATTSIVRSATSQVAQDVAITPEGLSCAVWSDSAGDYRYQINDTQSSQIVVPATTITSTSGTVVSQARVFLLGSFFIILFLLTVGGATHLQYKAIPIQNPTSPRASADFGGSSLTVNSITAGYDAHVVGSMIVAAWHASGAVIRIASMTSTFQFTSQATVLAHRADFVSVTANAAAGIVWVSFWDPVGVSVYVTAYNLNLINLLPPTVVFSSAAVCRLTSIVDADGVLTVLYELATTYNYAPNARTHLVGAVTATTAIGNTFVGNTTSGSPIITVTSGASNTVLGATVTGLGLTGNGYIIARTATTVTLSENAAGTFTGQTYTITPGIGNVVVRSAGLASKPALIDGLVYVAVVYGTGINLQPTPGGGVFQPTYFLLSLAPAPAADAISIGNLVAKLAYSNAGGYPASQVLPGASLNAGVLQIGYLFKDLLTAVNKAQAAPSVNGIYSQTGINLASWQINTNPMAPAEIGNNLHLGGGFTWMYDGVKPVEHNFHVFPEDITAVPHSTGGLMTAQQYYYQVVYEWTDAQGNIHRSAPSIPVGAVAAAAISSVTLNIPTLRLTYKTGNNYVRIVIYRWSTAQQNYYQITSVQAPIFNDTSVNSIVYLDTLADSAIIGNQLIYTTGGVIENVAFPGSDASTLYKSRMVIIDAEDKNLLWFSKQVIENVPVEPSDLFTLYVAPTAGAQGSTGINTALGAMDDKLIVFKRNAIYYITGTGPDNTGANNDFSEPNYITSVAGCTNPQSIVSTPQGLMFQSDKGIWLLGRDLSTSYIGSPVEQYNSATVVAAVNVPGTNQVRFTLDTGVTLMYDYFYGQWGTFAGIPGTASTLYQNLHTYVNSLGATYQETVGSYLDGSSPVLMAFTTGWMSLAGLQGFERAYFFYLLGTYISPHKLSIGIAYDFDPSINQLVSAVPNNFTPAYGLQAGPYGSGDPYGGVSNVEQFRIFMDRQKCQAFQITLNEIFDPTLGTTAGAGLTLSGINLVVGAKKSYATLRAAQSVS